MKTLAVLLSTLFLPLFLLAGDKDLPARSPRLEGYGDMTEVIGRLSSQSLHDVEGLWRFPGSGATVAIQRDIILPGATAGVERYTIVIINAADRTLRPGTVMGAVRRSGTRNVYEGHIYTSLTHGKERVLTSPKRFILQLSDDGAFLNFEPRKSSLRVNLWALLPYMFRRVVRPREDTKHSDGCVRLYPEPSVPVNPRYL